MLNKYKELVRQYLDLFPSSMIREVQVEYIVDLEQCVKALERAISEQTSIDDLGLRKLWGLQVTSIEPNTYDGWKML
jgi:hypothetical protein